MLRSPSIGRGCGATGGGQGVTRVGRRRLAFASNGVGSSNIAIPSSVRARVLRCGQTRSRADSVAFQQGCADHGDRFERLVWTLFPRACCLSIKTGRLERNNIYDNGNNAPWVWCKCLVEAMVGFFCVLFQDSPTFHITVAPLEGKQLSKSECDGAGGSRLPSKPKTHQIVSRM